MSACAPQVPPPEPAQAELADTVRRCRRERRFLAELAGLYEEIDRLTTRGGWRCLGGGGCCKFDLAGHRLYLTAGEMAMLVETPPPAAMAPPNARSKLRCPYQRRGRCSAHARRPLGCRIYFCRRTASGAASDAYEVHHRRIALLHERFGLPYLYVELTAGLADALGQNRVLNPE